MKNISVCLFMCLLLNFSFAQEVRITFSDFLNFAKTSDFPADVFSCLEKKKYEYVKKVNFNEYYSSLVKEFNKDFSSCNLYYYANSSSSVAVSFCGKLETDSINECKRMISMGCNTPDYYDNFVNAIKANCIYQKTIDIQHNGIPVKSYEYKNKSGAVFSFHKYLGPDNKMEYYIIVKI